jgi:ceramide glucosyltransferase
MQWITTVRVVVLILAVAPLVYYLLSLYCIVDYFRVVHKLHPPDHFFAPPASILKPVRGVDSEAYENFASYCRLSYPNYELLFATADPNDPVIPVIQRLQKDFPKRQIRLVTGVERLGENNKVNNLCRLVKEARYDLLVMTDSDIRVQPNYLWEVAGPFADHNVGAVTSFARSCGGGTLSSDLSMLNMSTDTIPSALVARKLEGKVQFAFGWTMATTKKHLAEIGGWQAMVNHHSDDFELGNRIAGRGYRVEFMREPVTIAFPNESFKEFWEHELRWAIGLRNVRPVGYMGAGLTQGLPWTLLASIVAGTAGWTNLAASYIAAYLLVRLTVAAIAGVWGLGDREIAKKLWLVPLRDAIGAAVWLTGLVTSKIHWRGLEYRVKDRLLVPVDTAIAQQQRPREKPALQ